MYVVLPSFVPLIVFVSVYIDKYRTEKDKEEKLIALSVILGVTLMLLAFYIYDEFFTEKVMNNRQIYTLIRGSIVRQFSDALKNYLEKNKDIQGIIADFMIQARKA